MTNTKRFLQLFAVGLFVHLMTGGTAMAGQIMGTFTLQQNTVPTTTYQGTFTTADTFGLGAGDVVALTAFNLSDNFAPTFTLAGPAPGGVDLTFSNVTFLTAILASENTVSLLSGITIATSGSQVYSLSFDADVTDPTPDWSIGGGFPPGLSLEGDQFIPEPTGIALFGAGLLAFGVVKRRKASKVQLYKG